MYYFSILMMTHVIIVTMIMRVSLISKKRYIKFPGAESALKHGDQVLFILI
jgi:hypothetical protein